MPYFILRLCNGTNTVAQGRVGEIRWCQAGWPNFRYGVKPALLSPGATQHVSHTILCECTKSDLATRPPCSSREHDLQRD